MKKRDQAHKENEGLNTLLFLILFFCILILVPVAFGCDPSTGCIPK